ncbi:MAG: hypothetical protein Q7O66_22660, partial [Dehalococcoidia bacterium]|nr:hypothetical protein [Dehalococcoidia bacterium]
VIVKWEVLSHGLKENEGLEKVSDWERAAGYYYHDGTTLKEMIEKRPDRVNNGLFKRPPAAFLMKNGLGVKIELDSTSDYQVKELSEGKFALFQGQEEVEDIYFIHPKRQATEEPRTSRGTPISNLVGSLRQCFRIAPVRHCEYFNTGEQCRFCNYNATFQDSRAIGLEVPTTILADETLEAYKLRAANVRFIEGRLVMGAITNSDLEVNTHLQFIVRLAKATPYLPNITLTTQPMSRANMLRLKDAGVSCVTMNMEVWDPQLFPVVCPGKAKHRGRERYLEAYQEAVEVFGWGHTGTNLPPGATLMPENGHKTWQEARDSQIDGIRWLIQHGAFPMWTSFRLGAGSVFGDIKANREKLPPTDYVLDIGLAHHQACTEYGMYDRMNKLMYCPMDCLSTTYAGEIGILERAGDVPSWAADALPAEATWLADFVKSVNPRATTVQ